MSAILLPRPFRLVLLLVVVLVSGCATAPSSKKVLWHSRDQFVNVVERDDQGREETPNAHPVSISSSRLRAGLASVTVKGGGDGAPVALFGEPELQVLSEQLAAGLQQAGPGQDLTFAVYGRVPLWKGLISEEVVSTGRVFYRDDRLNVIVGMVREQIRESDRRLQPFVPGSRDKGAALSLAVTSPLAAYAPQRHDWLLMTLPEEVPVQAAQKPEQGAPQQARPELRPEVPAQPAQAVLPGNGFEERLRVLGELRAKGLITEEEYRLKKESILREL